MTNGGAGPDKSPDTLGSLKSAMNTIRISINLWQLLCIVALVAAVLIFVIFVLPHLLRSSDPTADNIDEEWSESIARLGIQPIFPPSEDLYVGDVFAVIVDPTITHRSFLSKAVRIGNIDLRNLLTKRSGFAPVFSETVPKKEGEEFRHQDRREVEVKDDHLLTTTIAVFPGVTITHRTKASTLMGTKVAGASAGSDSVEFEEISIPVTETYGVSVADGIGALDNWCQHEPILCSDNYARRMLAYSLGDFAVDKNADGTYKTTIQIRLVIRVFMSREFNNHRENSSAGGLGIGLSSADKTSAAQQNVAAANTPANTPASEVENKSPPQITDKDLAPFIASLASQVIDKIAGNASLGRFNGSTLGLNEVLARPLVFGVRTIAIDPLEEKK